MSMIGNQFGLFTFADWSRGACGRPRAHLKSFSVAATNGERLQIEPGVVEHRGVTVAGHDWIPILHDGRGTIDRMVHSPELHFAKMRNVAVDGDLFQMTVERTLVCSRDALLIGGSRNYYHWLIDHVPRLQWAIELGLLERRVAIINDQLEPFQKESLALMGLTSDQWLEVGDDEAILCSKLMVPTLLARSTIVHPAVTGLLKRAFSVSKQSKDRLIYVSQGDDGSPQLVNEDELKAALQSFGFEIVTPKLMSFHDQISLFASARMVVGSHNERLANIVFCSPGAHVIEIFARQHKSSSMQFLSALRRHHHTMVPSEVLSARPDGNSLLGSWKVNVSEVQRAVRQALEFQPE